MVHLQRRGDRAPAPPHPAFREKSVKHYLLLLKISSLKNACQAIQASLKGGRRLPLAV
jgi:hypothetical protein